MTSDAAGPLDGVKVLDFTQVFMGPSATQLLGDYGADVTKVERPGTGDLSRTALPDADGLDGPIFLAINRNKRSVAVDMRSDRGREVIRELVLRSDVLVSNFRPGVMEKMGLGYDAVRVLNPRLIWASGSGFGEEGPYVGKGGQDVIAQAYTGLIARRTDSSLPLTVYPTALCDYTTGMHLVQGIVMALYARERTGQGQMVRVNMFSSALHLQMQEAATRLNRGHEVNWAQACKGEATASAPFDYSAALTETMLLGIAALRAGQGKKLLYDGGAMRFTNMPDADRYLTREYRGGWEL